MNVRDRSWFEGAIVELGVDQASLIALRQFRNMVQEGWSIGAVGGELKKPHFALSDAGLMTDLVIRSAESLATSSFRRSVVERRGNISATTAKSPRPVQLSFILAKDFT